MLVSPPVEGIPAPLTTTTPANSRSRRTSSRRRVPASLPPHPPPGDTTDDSVTIIPHVHFPDFNFHFRWLEAGPRCLWHEQLQWLQAIKIMIFVFKASRLLLWKEQFLLQTPLKEAGKSLSRCFKEETDIGATPSNNLYQERAKI